MKTLKIILLSAIAGAAVYSCSVERDDEVQKNPTIEKKLDLKPLKTENNQESTAKGGDSTSAQTQIAFPNDPLNPTDPNDPEIIPPGDIKPPKP
jgi:hypothetical protein